MACLILWLIERYNSSCGRPLTGLITSSSTSIFFPMAFPSRITNFMNDFQASHGGKTKMDQ